MKKLYLFYKDLLTANKNWIKRIAQWAGLWFAIGAVAALLKPEWAERFLNFLQELFEKILPSSDFTYSFATALLIFKQNIQASLIVLFFGIILGLIPLISTAFNFFILGFLFAYLLGKSVTSAFIFLLIILPHGIFEIPALLIADAFGIRLGWFWKIKDPTKTKGQKLLLALKQNFQLVPPLLILLIIAALIEIFVSGKIAQWFEPVLTVFR